jgi:molybdopterin converting factor subunit 1
MRILFFAQLREITGAGEVHLDLGKADDAGVWQALVERWPDLAAHRPRTRLARNGVYADDGEIFSADDEIALIPPVSGG